MMHASIIIIILYLGRIAEEYGKLVKEYWSGEYTIVAPTKFKQVLGDFQPRFSGYQQQGREMYRVDGGLGLGNCG